MRKWVCLLLLLTFLLTGCGREEAMETILSQLEPDTAMLVKASHVMRFEEIVTKIKQQSDME